MTTNSTIPTIVPIGATVSIQWEDALCPPDVRYVSFGRGLYTETDGSLISDSFGVPDEDIFYYFPDGEEELKEMMTEDHPNDFRIISYEIKYKMQGRM